MSLHRIDEFSVSFDKLTDILSKDNERDKKRGDDEKVSEVTFTEAGVTKVRRIKKGR